MRCRSLQLALSQADLSPCRGAERWRPKSCALHHRVAETTNTVSALIFCFVFYQRKNEGPVAASDKLFKLIPPFNPNNTPQKTEKTYFFRIQKSLFLNISIESLLMPF
ncbi:hypothetical protein C4F40_19590 [Sphingobacterium sp. Ka21]|uniref:Uncharacterized protein n=1 Tax=Sphingobacterium pedocola TaxID=2082722 RepID=A0ABR9TC34_9SPHI|nr:hypothetical protein [Sphingobacterium pedocola]